LRLLVTETLDPDGAMASWASPDLAALGHEVLALPSQELAPMLGPGGLAALVEAIAEQWRPDVVLLCPPYDHVGRDTLERLASLGARTVAFAFDEPLFSGAQTERFGARCAFSHIFVTAPREAKALGAMGAPASYLRWAASRAAFSPGSAPEVSSKVVLVGRPYARRVALLASLAREGLPVAVFGHGWSRFGGELSGVEIGGPLSGPEMHTVLASAGAVITTGDWEDEPIAMVKYRLLEAAFCGARQVAQASPDLRSYFTADEVPDYRDATDLVSTLRAILADPDAATRRAERARARAISEHTWTSRWVELSAALALPDLPARPRAVPASYVAGLAMLAHDAERRGADRLARAAFERWASLKDDATAEAGLARLALRAGDHANVAHHAARARAIRTRHPHASDGLHATLPAGGGLGLVGFLDPRAEYLALELAALIETDPETARQRVSEAAHTPTTLVAAATVLVPTEQGAEVWRALFELALALAPGHAHAGRWRDYLGSAAGVDVG
jgi:hypothetical protein